MLHCAVTSATIVRQCCLGLFLKGFAKMLPFVAQASYRRSTSFGGNGFALPGDPTDLLRGELVTSKVRCLAGLLDTCRAEHGPRLQQLP